MILDVERVFAERGEVLEVDDARGVRADVDATEGVKLLVARQLVLIEVDLFCGLERALLATEDRVVLPLLRARVIPVAVLPVRHRRVGFLDAAHQLLVDRLLQRFGVPHARGGVGVLGLEVLDHLGIRLLAKPEVVVGARFVVKNLEARLDRRDRWRRGFLSRRGHRQRHQRPHQPHARS